MTTPHAFWIVTGTLSRTTIPFEDLDDGSPDLTWIVATCLTPEAAFGVREALVTDVRRLVAMTPCPATLSVDPAFDIEITRISARTNPHTLIEKIEKMSRALLSAIDPYIERDARIIATRMVHGIVPMYEVYRSYDDFTKLAACVTVTGEEAST